MVQLGIMKIQHLIILFLFTVLASCGNNSGTEDTETPVDESIVSLTEAQIKNAGIQTGKPETGKISSILKVNGIVEAPPQNRISVSFPLGGYLKSTHLMEGSRVKKGEVIAVMEDPSFIQLQQDYLIAKSRAYFLQKEYERQKLLNQDKSTSDKVFEQTESEYQMQRITAGSLRQKLVLVGLNPDKLSENNISRTINIYSPIDGYVSDVNVNIGKFVNPSDVLFELINPSDLHLVLKVFEKDIHNIEAGQKIKAHMANHPEKTFEAEVILVSKNLDANRTAIIHCHFDKTDHELLPGMFLNAEIAIVTDEAILVPDAAVVRLGAHEYIFIDKGNHQFEMTMVSVGNLSDGKTAISNSEVDLLKQNIIVTNAYAALMKLKNKEED